MVQTASVEVEVTTKINFELSVHRDYRTSRSGSNNDVVVVGFDPRFEVVEDLTGIKVKVWANRLRPSAIGFVTAITGIPEDELRSYPILDGVGTITVGREDDLRRCFPNHPF